MISLQVIQVDEWFAGILLSAFLGIIVWIFTRSIKSQDQLSDSVTSLQITLEGLKTLVDGIVKDREQSKENCHDRHEGVNDWMNEHETTLKDHGTRITVIETTLSNKPKISQN